MTKEQRLAFFGPLTAELNAALTARGFDTPSRRRALAKEVGCVYESLWSYSTGRVIPSVGMCAKLADALAWPRIVTISEQLRLKVCSVCDASFVDTTVEMKRIYCSRRCLHVGNTRNRRGIIREQITITKRLLERHREVVRAFCHSCAEGVCPNPACELRPISPMPLPRGQQWAEVRRQTPWLVRKEA